LLHRHPNLRGTPTLLLELRNVVACCVVCHPNVGAVEGDAKRSADTRENRIRRFHEDPACTVIIANPAAAGEGISLHEACHNAIYLDRSYNTTHYLQSIDRIHRLGLKPGVETYIHIFQTVAPQAIGSIDRSVNHRLAMKLRNL
jgi:hypothetical protein